MRIKGVVREKVRKNQTKMRVTGAGLRNLWRIIADKAAKARGEKL
jgi:hypothetical protein